MKKNTSRKLHVRNRHQGRYDLLILSQSLPELKSFITPTPSGLETIDFFNPKAVKTLNKALLFHYYNLHFWDIPEGYLCPPIPGRADYLHYAADVLASSNQGKIPRGEKIKCWDIGTGANLIYPIIGHYEYGWSFTGSEIDKKAVFSAQHIIDNNLSLQGKINVKFQEKHEFIFKGILNEKEKFDLVICNPPFHSSAEEAKKASIRKISNLKKKKIKQPKLNFSGQAHELWCEGGEVGFIQRLIQKSISFSSSIFWFTSLVSKSDHLTILKRSIEKTKAKDIRIIEMKQGQKTSRLIAWTFLSKDQQKEWAKNRWK